MALHDNLLATLFSLWDYHIDGPYKAAISYGIDPSIRGHYNQGEKTQNLTLRTACRIADMCGYKLILVRKESQHGPE